MWGRCEADSGLSWRRVHYRFGNVGLESPTQHAESVRHVARMIRKSCLGQFASVACRLRRTGPHEKPSHPERRSRGCERWNRLRRERWNRLRREIGNRRGCERWSREMRRPRSWELARTRNHRTDPGIVSRWERGSCDSPPFATGSSQSRGSNVIPTFATLGRESVMEPHSLLHRGSEIPRAGFEMSRVQTMKRNPANVTRGKMYGLFARRSQRGRATSYHCRRRLYGGSHAFRSCASGYGARKFSGDRPSGSL